MEQEQIIPRVFQPIPGKDMRSVYEELAEFEEFENLSNAELEFSWYMGCVSSPFYLIRDNHERMKLSAAKAFRGAYVPQGVKDGNLSAELDAAIERFKQFYPPMRMHAKNLIDTIFDNWTLLASLNTTDMEHEAMAHSEKKAYVEMTSKIASEMQNIIRQKEQGFGVSKLKKKTKEGSDSNLMDSILNE